MLENYLSILIFIALGLIMGMAPIILSNLVAKKHPEAAKLAPYECGFEPFGDARLPFDVRYYLVAILFIIFDLETAFFFPWAIALRDIGWFGIGAMGIFLTLLTLGFIYEWKMGALEWE